MNEFTKELIESLREACDHAEGKPSSVRMTVADLTNAAFNEDQKEREPRIPARRVGRVEQQQTQSRNGRS